MSHLKKFGIAHQSIKCSNFTIDKNNSVKVIDPLAKTLLNNCNRVKSNTHYYPKEVYLSPYEYDCIKNNTEPKKGHEYADDMFSLGMVILEIGILKTLEDVYSLTEGIRVVVLINYLHELENKCGSSITSIVKKLLHFQEENRLTLEELEGHIKVAMESKQDHENSTCSGIE